MRFIEDTNVISRAAKDAGYGALLQKERERLEADGGRHAISPVVLIELLHGMAKSKSSLFQQNRERFKVLKYRGQSEFLRFPAAFALNSVLGIESPVTEVRPGDFRQWLEVVCAAQNREELLSGSVDLNGLSPMSYGFDFGLLARNRDERHRVHVERMKAVRHDGLESASPEVWVGELLKTHNFIRPKPEEISALCPRLEAAYLLDKELMRLSRDTDYKFDHKERSGDALDDELLFYLADSDLLLITGDRKLKTRICASSQASRVMLLIQ
jgi:hypothetical protein